MSSAVDAPGQVRATNALTGRLELVASRIANGRTSVTKQFHTVPFHISKPYWDGEVLVVQVVNPTAGIFEGDRMECLVEVEAGASLAFASPSASRAHTMAGPGIAKLRQRFHVAEGGWLEVAPELFIPQRASSFSQTTEVVVEAGASLYFVETLAPGRVAHGERFAFRSIDWSFSLRFADKLVALERALVEPPGECWMFEVKGWEHAYYGSVWMAGAALAELPDGIVEEIEGLTDPGACLTGISKTTEACYSIKIMARSSIVLRRTLASVRGIMSARLPLLARNLRKMV